VLGKKPNPIGTGLQGKVETLQEKPKCFPEKPNPLGAGLQDASGKNPNASRKNPTPLELAFKEKSKRFRKKTNASRKNPTALELALKAKSKRFREKPKCFPEEPNPIGTGLQGKVVTLQKRWQGSLRAGEGPSVKMRGSGETQGSKDS
jgi:hypothetical protein